MKALRILFASLVCISAYASTSFRQNLVSGLRQSPGIETVEDGGSITAIQPPSSTTQSQELSRSSNGKVLTKRCTSPKVVFAPDSELLKLLIALIDQERESIKIAADHLNNRDLATTLVDAKERGVAVEVIVDRVATKPKFPVHSLAEAGIPVYVYDASPPPGDKRTKAKPHMHHKFCLFGNNGGKGKLLWTGTLSLSYRRSKANRENAMVFTDEAIVAGYEQEFTEIKKGSCKELLTKK